MKNLLLIQPKSFLKRIYPKAIWNFKREEKKLYLTFDDGPIPELTEWVIDELGKFNAKATFFCVGANILKHYPVFEKLKSSGHTVANHTMFHTKGFQTPVSDYVKETEDCQRLVENRLFRPPYGKLKPSQYKALIEKKFKIVFWDVISYDYETITPVKCANNVIKHARNGSIVLFHDSIKAEKNLRYSLPLVLEYFTRKGFTFEAITA